MYLIFSRETREYGTLTTYIYIYILVHMSMYSLMYVTSLVYSAHCVIETSSVDMRKLQEILHAVKSMSYNMNMYYYIYLSINAFQIERDNYCYLTNSP